MNVKMGGVLLNVMFLFVLLIAKTERVFPQTNVNVFSDSQVNFVSLLIVLVLVQTNQLCATVMVNVFPQISAFVGVIFLEKTVVNLK